MEKIVVNFPRFNQEIYIGTNVFPEAVSRIKSLGYDGYLIVVDKGAYKKNKALFEYLFSELSVTIGAVIKLTPTQKSKDFTTAEKILRRLTELHATRRTCILAVGGGYVGDVVGFASAIYMRGIHFVQIPTTLMAQVDAIVGKVAINFNGKKNQLGSFYSPRLVFCDIDFVNQFAFKELVYGLTEVWKHALLVNESAVIKSIEDCLITQGRNVDYGSMVRFSLETKGNFVEEDPEDVRGIHKALSLGHTLANVLEAKLHLRHGEAVYYGILFEALLSRELGKFTNEHLTSLVSTARLFEKQFNSLSTVQRFVKSEDLAYALKGDKINSHGTYSFVVPTTTGFEIAKGITPEQVYKTVDKFSNFTLAG